MNDFRRSSQPLPSGTLTFFFTDIEGSTRLWELYPDPMRLAMVRHDALIETLVEQHQGVIVRPRGEGDSRFAVFTHPGGAIRAACAVQRALHQEPWGLPSPLRVRIGLHTGPADLRDGDYYGPEVNRCARLRNAAYGGQTLVSQSTYKLVCDSLPDSISLRDLGEHRLKDLQRPERIFQIVAPDLPVDFPPLKTLEKPITNLPLALTSFIGRDREIEEVKQLLVHGRLLTIVGPGGAGKTRLALHAAADLIYPFEDGVWLIDLARLTKQELILQYVAELFGLREEEGVQMEQSLLNFLRKEKALFVMDNCEHIIQGVAQFTEMLLRSAPELRILATSREPLGITGETVWRIPPLSTPRLSAQVTPERLMRYEAVKLFVDRAKSVQPAFTITDQNAQAVAKIAARLDGIPLAIELAAARLRVLTVEDIAARLDDRFRLLVSGSRTALPRQQTLRALIDWSYDLLTQAERSLLQRLSVFTGSWTLTAAEAICSGNGIEMVDVLDLLTHLIDKSLVNIGRSGGYESFHLLETIRQYASERLEESGEREELSRRHAEYFMTLAEKTYPDMWGPSQAAALARLEADHDNLRAALEWTAQDVSRAEWMLRMAGSLWRFWEIRGHVSEGRAWLERALTSNPDASTYLRANGLRGLGNLTRLQGDYKQAKATHSQSLELFRQLGDKVGIARELNDLGEIAHQKGDYLAAVELHTESLALRYEIADKEGLAVSLGHLGTIAIDRGQFMHARALLEEGLRLNRELGDSLFTALSLNNLGLVAYLSSEYDRATQLFEEALSKYRELMDALGISNALMNLANIARDQGYYKRAKELYAECLALKQEIGDKRGVARVMAGMAEVAIGQGDYPRAADLAERSLALSRSLGVKRNVIMALEERTYVAYSQGDYERALSLANESLALAHEISAPRGVAYTTCLLALIAFGQGKIKEAWDKLSEALDIFQKIGDRRSHAIMSINLARIAYRQGRHATAAKILDKSLAVSRQLDLRWGIAHALEIKGLLQRSGGKFSQALESFKESLRISVEQENVQGILNCFAAIAGLATVNGRPVQAVRLFAAEEAMRLMIGVQMSGGDQREYNYYRELLRDQMDETAFRHNWAEGCSLSIDQALVEIESLHLH